MRIRACGVGLLWAACAGAQEASAGTCALCRQALASGGSPGLVQGFYWSILLIAGVPLAIFAAAVVFAWRFRARGGPPR